MAQQSLPASGVDVSTVAQRVALIGTRVTYHGSLTHHHGPAVVVQTCGAFEFCGSQPCDDSPTSRYVLRTEPAAPAEPRGLFHVSPSSFSLIQES